jgi:hypothetical protein
VRWGRGLGRVCLACDEALLRPCCTAHHTTLMCCCACVVDSVHPAGYTAGHAAHWELCCNNSRHLDAVRCCIVQQAVVVCCGGESLLLLTCLSWQPPCYLRCCLVAWLLVAGTLLRGRRLVVVVPFCAFLAWFGVLGGWGWVEGLHGWAGVCLLVLYAALRLQADTHTVPWPELPAYC